MSQAFVSAKRTILHKLRVEIDFSPKGSLDSNIVSLIHAINSCIDYVTTSSCSGRIALYCHDGSVDVGVSGGVSGRNDGGEEVVAQDSKGNGRWLLVDHDGPLEPDTIARALEKAWSGSTVFLKVEPFILHVQVRNMDSAVRLLGVALRAGYRESGIVMGNSGRGKIIVAVRSTAGGMDAPLLWAGNPILRIREFAGTGEGAFCPEFLHLVDAANTRLASVHSRRARFQREFFVEHADDINNQPRDDFHGSTVHAQASLRESLIVCSLCDSRFPSRNSLFRHLSGGVCSVRSPQSPCELPSTHNKMALNQCRGCGENFQSRNALFKHVPTCCPLGKSLKRPAPPQSILPSTSVDSHLLGSIEKEARSLAINFLAKKMAEGRERTTQPFSNDREQQDIVRFLPPTQSLLRYGHCSAKLPYLLSGRGDTASWRGFRGKETLGFPQPATGEVLVVFGGCRGGVGNHHGRTNDVVCVFPGRNEAGGRDGGGPAVEFVTSVEFSESSTPSATRPVARVRATLAPIFLDGEWVLLLFGGHNGPSNTLGDAWVLRLRVGVGGTSSGGDVRDAGFQTVVQGMWTPISFLATPTCPTPPAPRFGHSMVDEEGKAAIMFGGRDAQNSFNDCWRFQIIRSGVEGGEGYDEGAAFSCEGFSLLATPLLSQDGTSSPRPRFSHASSCVSFNGENYLLVQGGYIWDSHMHAAVGATSSGSSVLLAQLNDLVLKSKGIIVGDMWVTPLPPLKIPPNEETPQPPPPPLHWLPCRFQFPEGSSSKSLERFSHTLTEVPREATNGKNHHSITHDDSPTLWLILGGECGDTEKNGPVFFMLHKEVLTASSRKAGVRSCSPPPIYTSFLNPCTTLHYGGARPSLSTGYGVSGKDADFLLPLRHTAHCTREGTVYVIGGGGVCFAFGSSFSMPLTLHPLFSPAVKVQLISASGRQSSGGGGKMVVERGNRGVLQGSETTTAQGVLNHVLTLPCEFAQRVKVELQQKDWFDWGRCMGPVSSPPPSSSSSSSVTGSEGEECKLIGIPLTEEGYEGCRRLAALAVKNNCTEEVEVEGGPPTPPLLLLATFRHPSTTLSPPPKAGLRAYEPPKDPFGGLAALSRASSSVSTLLLSTLTEEDAANAATAAALAKNKEGAAVETATSVAGDRRSSSLNPPPHLDVFGGVSAVELVAILCKPGGLEGRGFPGKVEWLSDILILPKFSFSSPHWRQLVPFLCADHDARGECSRGYGGSSFHSPSPSSQHSPLPTTPLASALWRCLANSFQTARVAIAGEILPAGGTRASGLRMLCSPPPPAGSFTLPPVRRIQGIISGEFALPPPSSLAHLPIGFGAWVEVKENGLAYTFDASRVMFSSGNVTEKARMGGLVGAFGETVVDLYAGIGYFSLPLLVKAGASLLHACEWNSDALTCLALNLMRHGVRVTVGDEGICHPSCPSPPLSMTPTTFSTTTPRLATLWPGDNTTLLKRAPQLRHCAHRVLLGLIPSSRSAWPVALQVLRQEGGMLHVHENVREGGEWVWATEHLLPSLEKIVMDHSHLQGFGWRFSVEHIERVKNYAPRVSHYVFDVRVTGIE